MPGVLEMIIRSQTPIRDNFGQDHFVVNRGIRLWQLRDAGASREIPVYELHLIDRWE